MDQTNQRHANGVKVDAMRTPRPEHTATAITASTKSLPV